MIQRILSIILLSLICQPVEAADPSPTFHHDNQRTGRSANTVASSRVLLWSYQTGGSIDASPVIAPDGTIYIASTDNRLYAFSPEGDLRWTFTAQENIFSTPSLGNDGTIYLADLTGRYYALNPDGTQKWVHPLLEGSDRRVVASPLVGADGRSYLGSWNNYFYALTSGGAEAWKVKLEGMISSPASMDPEGNIFLATMDDWEDTETEWDDLRLAVYKFSSGSSAPVWKFNETIDLHRNRIIAATAIDYDRGQLYVGVSKESSGGLYALQWSDGSKKFETQLPKGIVSSPAIGADGTIYVGCLDGKLYAVDWVTAGVKWSFSTGAYYILGSPTVDAAGTIYIGDSDGVLHALSPGGQELWRFSANSNIASAPAIGNNGTLYLTSYDGSVYAIGAPTQRYWRGLYRRNSPTHRQRP